MKTLAASFLCIALSGSMFLHTPMVHAHAQHTLNVQVTATPTAKQLQKLGLKGATLSTLRDGIWKVNQNGKVVGHIVNSLPFAKNIKGYVSATPVLIFINVQKNVQHILLLPNGETLDFFRKAAGIVRNWKNVTAKKGAALQVDAVTGATYSSDALSGHIKAALAAYNQYVK